MSNFYPIPEQVVPGKRLGRHVGHDPANKSYRVARSTATPATTTHKRLIPILNQGDLGSCTGNATTGALGSSGVFETLNLPTSKLDEPFAVKIYSKATTEDSYDGQYPPTDTGSDGPSAMKAARDLGYLSGYVHALSMDDLLAGLQDHAGIIGINWYDSFDGVGSDGKLSLPKTAKVRGGHELHLLNCDMGTELLEVPNSWGPSWAKAGTCFIPFTVMERLLSEDGDATFPVPLNQPSPTPNPTPVPTASTTWTGTPDQAAAISTWAGKPHLFHNATVAAKAWNAGTLT